VTEKLPQRSLLFFPCCAVGRSSHFSLFPASIDVFRPLHGKSTSILEAFFAYLLTKTGLSAKLATTKIASGYQSPGGVWRHGLAKRVGQC